MKRGYQREFYHLSERVRDEESRASKARKIQHILSIYAPTKLHSSNCLDVGSSSGFITAALAPLFRFTVGVEYDSVALRHVPKENLKLDFVQGDAMTLPAAAESIDIVVCAQVYEHVPSDEKLFDEIYRVLKPGGVVFFSGPNKFFPIEPHYFLPFLHWLPRSWADRYLYITGRGRHYYEQSRHYWSLRRLLSKFTIQDVTVAVFRWDYLENTDGSLRWLLSLPAIVWQVLAPFFPNFNWLLFKE